MLEIIRTIIERLLSWPVAAVVIGLIFKAPLSHFLRRVSLLKGVGIEVSAFEGAALKQLDLREAAEADPLAAKIWSAGSITAPRRHC
jgi:hypothetical protein